MATILVVDDERMICDMLRAVLARHGHDVLTAHGGREGLQLFRQHRPQVTLLDLRMPDLDGISVLKQIRQVDPQATVMILTGAGTDALEQQAWTLGVTDFLRKGIPLDALERALERVMRQPLQAPGEARSGAAAGMATGASVLVVDDEPMFRSLVTKYLTRRGYQVREARNGQEALALVKEAAPQVIILDLYMPGMNGVMVLVELRGMQYKGNVIVLTGSQDERVLKEALNLGSLDVLSKPVDLERLALTIEVGVMLAG